LASACLSLNVPSAAYTSIIGIGRLLQLGTLDGTDLGIHRTVCIFQHQTDSDSQMAEEHP